MICSCGKVYHSYLAIDLCKDRGHKALVFLRDKSEHLAIKYLGECFKCHRPADNFNGFGKLTCGGCFE